jgi:aquaporin Z
MGKYIAEFIGTFFLVFSIILSVNGGAGIFAPLAIGTVLIIMIYSLGPISKAHFNPAVTLSVFLRGGCTARDIPGYIIAQVVGALLATGLGIYLLGKMGLSPIAPQPVKFLPALVAEFLGTFALCWVILQVAFSKKTEGNSYYGAAIGMTVVAGSYALGGFSGGAFNPAVALAMSIADMTAWSNMGMFLSGQILAGISAAEVFKLVSRKD